MVQIKAASASVSGGIQVKVGDEDWKDAVGSYQVDVSDIKSDGDADEKDDKNANKFFTFTPDLNANGKKEIKFTLHDKELGKDFDPSRESTSKTSLEATMTITVEAVNDRPSKIELTGSTDDDASLSQSAGFVVVDDRIHQLNKHGNMDGAAQGQFRATDVEDTNNNAAASSTEWASYRPFSVGGADAKYFKVEPTKAETDVPATWSIERNNNETRKPAGETYNLTITFTDAGGAMVSEDIEIVQGVSETGLYLQSTNDPDGASGDLTATNNAKEYSNHFNVLSQNRGGATLAEGQDVPRTNREADNQDNTDDQDTTNDETFDFTGGLVKGGVTRDDGTQTYTPIAPKITRPTIKFDSKDDGGVAATVGVKDREITITLELGASAAAVTAALNILFGADDQTGTDAASLAINAQRTALKAILNLDSIIEFKSIENERGAFIESGITGDDIQHILIGFEGDELGVAQKKLTDLTNLMRQHIQVI